MRGADEAPILLARAHHEAPARSRPTVLIEASRILNQVEVLRKAWRGGSWRAGLALASKLPRTGEEGEAILKLALEESPGCGRLWAAWARRLEEREEAAAAVMGAGLRLVPRAGELWAERGRAAARKGNWAEAGKFLSHALVFTPQYGDVFLEMARASLWRLLARQFGLSARLAHLNAAELDSVLKSWNTTEVEHLTVLCNPNHGSLWDELAFERGWGVTPIEVLAAHKLRLLNLIRNPSKNVDDALLVRDVLFNADE